MTTRIVTGANGIKYITNEPKLDQGADYERGFVDGMQKQMQSSVDKAVNRMAQRPWVSLTDEELDYLCHLAYTGDEEFALTVQAKLKEKNHD
jgi:hypothetical protein